MARIKLDFPDVVFTFSTELTVRFDDVNLGNHLGNDRLVSLLGEARSQYLASLGLSDGPDPANPQAPGTIIADLAVMYRAEGRLRDRLLIEIGVAERNRYGGDLAYRVTRPADGTLIALAKTGLVFFDYTAGRMTSAPAAFEG